MNLETLTEQEFMEYWNALVQQSLLIDAKIDAVEKEWIRRNKKDE